MRRTLEVKYSCTHFPFFQDFFDNDLKPIMEESVAKRKKDKLEQVWRQLGNQLQDWVAGSVSSLYEEDTPSIEIGHFQKKFAKVDRFYQISTHNRLYRDIN